MDKICQEWSMIFSDVISPNLPIGDSLTKIEITVDDGLGTTGSTVTKEITKSSGSITITDKDNNIDMMSENRTYTFTVKVITSLCPDGVTFVYAGRYVHGL